MRAERRAATESSRGRDPATFRHRLVTARLATDRRSNPFSAAPAVAVNSFCFDCTNDELLYNTLITLRRSASSPRLPINEIN